MRACLLICILTAWLCPTMALPITGSAFLETLLERDGTNQPVMAHDLANHLHGHITPFRAAILSIGMLRMVADQRCQRIQSVQGVDASRAEDADTPATLIPASLAPASLPISGSAPGNALASRTLQQCVAVDPRATDAWCNSNCNHDPPHCPTALCQCSTSPASPEHGSDFLPRVQMANAEGSVGEVSTRCTLRYLQIGPVGVHRRHPLR